MLQLIIFGALYFIATVHGHGQLTIINHPQSLVFKGHEHLKESELPEVYSACLGFSVNQYSDWEGMFIQDPFNLAEVIATVAIDGLPNFDYSKGHHFALRTDTSEADVYSELEKRITERYPESNTNLVRIDLTNGLEEVQNYDMFKGIKSDKPKKSTHTHLKNSIDEDREFLKDIELLNAISTKIEQGAIKSNNIPDIFWFRIGSLHAIADLYGINSTQTKEAKQLVNEAISRLNTAFKKQFDGKLLFNVITSDAIHTRRGRSILAAGDGTDQESLNLAKNYDANYPVIFNIILWFGVAMFFSLLAICIAIGTMDPGRDSIIYRMTSTRMKKDN